MRFGWLTLAHSPSAEADYAAIEDLLVEACRAEDVGFDGVWLTEHNFTGEAVYCDPIPFASALAVRSSSHEPITLPRRHSSAISGRSSVYW